MSDKKKTLTCFHSGAFYVTQSPSGQYSIEHLPGDRDPSDIHQGLLDAATSCARVARPAIRSTALSHGLTQSRDNRGKDAFVEVPWDEALDLAADHLGRIYKDFGPQAVFGGSYGWASAGRFHHAQSQIHRFLNCLGGYTGSIGTYSHAALEGLCPFVIGDFVQEILKRATTWPVLAEHTKLFVLLGGLPAKNGQIAAGGASRHIVQEALKTAKANGASFVNISPQRSDCPDQIAAEWMPIRPGTDTAMMLAMAHVLWTEGLADTAFLQSHCTGWDRFLPYLLGQSDGQPKTPQWAADITGLPADKIAQLARDMARQRCLINMAWALQRAEHGEQPAWMVIVLAAMLGQIGLPGGGFGLGYGSDNGAGHPVRPFRYGALPQGHNPVKDHIPVARITDALLNPGAAYDFMGETRAYPDIRAVYWAGGNPFHHHQDLTRLRRAFRQPELVVVNEPFWTATARHADIVFPATTPLERRDIAMGSYDTGIVAMDQVMPPIAGARDDFEIFAELSARLGCAPAFTEGGDAEAWIEKIWTDTKDRAEQAGRALPTLKALRAQGYFCNAPDQDTRVLFQDFRSDPKAYPLSTPSGRIEIFSEKIASFGLPNTPGHPVWSPPTESLISAQQAKFPLHLLSPQPATRLHSQFDAGQFSQGAKVSGREALTLHPQDANARGLVNGDVAHVFNDRGGCYAGVIVSEDIREGCVCLPTGAWFDPNDQGLCKQGNPNVLTRDIGTSSLAQGPSAMTTLVEVEKAQAPPETDPFQPPLAASHDSLLPE